MTWHVQYRSCGADLVARFASPELAIEGACGFIDAGDDVYGIGTGPLSDSIGKEQIAKIHALWSNAATILAAKLRQEQNAAPVPKAKPLRD
jgi:hypothetical protein